MKKSLQSKLKTYSSVAAGVLIASSAGAQIVYTDVNPDVTINNLPSSFDIDMNGDATPDFQIKMFNTSSSSSSSGWDVVRVDPMSSSSLNGVQGTSYVDVLNLNDMISSGQSFIFSGWGMDLLDFTKSTSTYSTTSGATYTYTNTYTDGNWGGTNTDKYIGVKFDITGSTHYGWIRVDADLSTTTSSSWSVTIKDFAYNSVAGGSILAGDMGGTTGISEAFNTLQAYSFNKNININFNKSDYANAQINVYNNLGQIVHTQEATQQKEVIDMSSHAMGVYYVKVQSDKGMISRKVFLK
jgi:Secretion system C-terminal sorting domain